jgi:hypothetical protein
MMLDPSDTEKAFIKNPADGLHFDETARLKSFLKR